VCSCHHNIARPQAADKRHGLPICKLVANTRKVADSRQEVALNSGAGDEVTNLHSKKKIYIKRHINCCQHLHNVLVSLLNPKVNKLSGVVTVNDQTVCS